MIMGLWNENMDDNQSKREIYAMRDGDAVKTIVAILMTVMMTKMERKLKERLIQ